MIQIKKDNLKYIQTRKIKVIDTDTEVVDILEDYFKDGYKEGTEINLGYRGIRNNSGNKDIVGYMYFDTTKELPKVAFTRAVSVVQWKKLEYYMCELGYEYSVNAISGAKTESNDVFFNIMENMLYSVLTEKKEKIYLCLNMPVNDKVKSILRVLIDLQVIQNIIITTDNKDFYKDLNLKEVQVQ